MTTTTKRPFSSISSSSSSSSMGTEKQKQQQQEERRPLVIVIAGPTGVGKSAVAEQLVKDLNGYVISADSVQVYEGVSIGANQPTKEERLKTPHALIDFLPPSIQNYNAADWNRDALQLIHHFTGLTTTTTTTPTSSTDDDDEKKKKDWMMMMIEERRKHHMDQVMSATEDGRTPIVVGGTMMYLQWLVHGRPDAQKPTAEALQKAADAMEQYKDDWEGAVQHVQQQGDVFARRVDQLCGQDWYRLRRILEVAYTSTSTTTQQQQLYTGQRTNGLLDNPNINLCCFFLCPNDRLKHMQDMDQRCHSMILRGLLTETTHLLQSNLPLDGQVARAIGYRQTIDFLLQSNNNNNHHHQQSLEEYMADFCTATRRYAKKQMAWFRKDSSFVFVPVPMELSSVEQRIAKTTQHIQHLLSSPTDYQHELTDKTIQSCSAQTRKLNEQQGPDMKFFIPQPHDQLQNGTPEYHRILQEVQTCRQTLLQQQQQQQQQQSQQQSQQKPTTD